MLESNKTTLCWPNYIDQSVLSGGSWESELPLNHLQSPIFSQFSQTTDANPASTLFKVELPKQRPVAVVALAAHNLSATAMWRVRVWFDSAETQLAWDSGTVDVWPSVFNTNELAWENDNWWSGTITDDDRDSFTPLATQFLPVQIAAAVTVELFDSANPDGHVVIGRVMVADAWQPVNNNDWGIQYGYQIATTFETAGDADQTEYADPKTPRRTVTFDLSYLNEAEAFRLLSLQRDQGVHGDVLYTPNISPGPTSFAQTFIGRLNQPNPITHPYLRDFTAGISLLEKL